MKLFLSRQFLWSALAVCFVAPDVVWAEGPAAAPDPLIELASRGTPETTVFIKKSDLAKIKLATPVVISAELTITHAGTGVYEIDQATQSLRFTPTREIPLKPGSSFGWVMKASTTLDQVTVSEKFTLPKKNGTWTVDPNTTVISEDGLSATMTDTHRLWDTLWRAWTFEDGDPTGPHSFELSIDEKTAATLKFEITAPQR